MKYKVAIMGRFVGRNRQINSYNALKYQSVQLSRQTGLNYMKAKMRTLDASSFDDDCIASLNISSLGKCFRRLSTKYFSIADSAKSQ